VSLATTLLAVASCGSPTSALKFLSGDKNKDVDVVLVNAEKAATCGFDFRGIVESDLSIPVIYCKHAAMAINAHTPTNKIASHQAVVKEEKIN
jgi:hypothetical protein